MMRWTPDATTTSSDDRETSPVQYLLDAVLDVFVRLNSRSLMVAVMVALIVATLVFGLSTHDALAGGRVCCGG